MWVRISNTARVAAHVAARVAARVPPAGPGAVRDSPSDCWWGRVGVARRHGCIIDGGVESVDGQSERCTNYDGHQQRCSVRGNVRWAWVESGSTALPGLLT